MNQKLNPGEPTQPANGAGTAAADEPQSLAAELEKVRAEAAAARDQALRAQAELENFRKRMRREMEEERRYADLPLLRDLLPVLDNIGRAVKAAESAPDVGGLLAGVKMVEQQLGGVLKQHHCSRIEADGVLFDPHLHQAISMQPREDVAPNSVLLVAQEGYQLHDRVIRPAQVIVSTLPSNAAEG